MNENFDSITQNNKAALFHSLHQKNEMLVLPNAWDSASAKIFEASGFPAIATTSSGISWSCGYKDGEHIPPALMIEVIQRITHSVNIPVTADIESGYYGNDMQKFSDFIGNVIEAGAVGINLEDSDANTHQLYDVHQQVLKIKTAKEISQQKKVNLFVNARTDAMAGNEDLNTKIKICISRAKEYEAAGADGIFIPFVKDIESVAQLKAAISLPLNILMADSLDVAELRKLKVNRVSVGSKPILTTMSLLKKISNDLRSGNDWTSLFVKEPNYDEMNKYFV
ncbi:MAG: isocitrate lyase/phosphoenolpyruvate mutase family protein [Bacteroidetes bacterium]|nr:isocitrate lyase/phosphoenolpyruvate mutase family protein [Bacteroidota bacterium]